MLRLIFGMQIENRIAGGKPLTSDHGLQIFYMLIVQRIELQNILLIE